MAKLFGSGAPPRRPRMMAARRRARRRDVLALLAAPARLTIARVIAPAGPPSYGLAFTGLRIALVPVTACCRRSRVTLTLFAHEGAPRRRHRSLSRHGVSGVTSTIRRSARWRHRAHRGQLVLQACSPASSDTRAVAARVARRRTARARIGSPACSRCSCCCRSACSCSSATCSAGGRRRHRDASST